jgi:hypothetical protein
MSTAQPRKGRHAARHAAPRGVVSRPAVANELPADALGAVTGPGGALGTVMRSAPLPAQRSAPARSAAPDMSGLATSSTRALTVGAERLASALPLAGLMPQIASASDGPLQLTPNLLRNGALGALTQGFAPQTNDLTGGLVNQATPLVQQLHQRGVPTVGDVTTQLSQAQLPVVGTVGRLTQTLPVTGVLGADNPVTGALQNVSQL